MLKIDLFFMKSKLQNFKTSCYVNMKHLLNFALNGIKI